MEMELAGLVWVIWKTWHLIKSMAVTPMVVFTDHGANINIFKQTSLESISVERLNLRIVRASQYIQRFDLLIQHKSGTSNIVPDALSQLPQIDDGELDALNADVGDSGVDEGHGDLDASAY